MSAIVLEPAAFNMVSLYLVTPCQSAVGRGPFGSLLDKYFLRLPSAAPLLYCLGSVSNALAYHPRGRWLDSQYSRLKNSKYFNARAVSAFKKI